MLFFSFILSHFHFFPLILILIFFPSWPFPPPLTIVFCMIYIPGWRWTGPETTPWRSAVILVTSPIYARTAARALKARKTWTVTLKVFIPNSFPATFVTRWEEPQKNRVFFSSPAPKRERRGKGLATKKIKFLKLFLKFCSHFFFLK